MRKSLAKISHVGRNINLRSSSNQANSNTTTSSQNIDSSRPIGSAIATSSSETPTNTTMAASSSALPEMVAIRASRENSLKYEIAKFNKKLHKQIKHECRQDLRDSKLSENGHIDGVKFLTLSEKRAEDHKLDLQQYLNYLVWHTSCSEQVYKVLIEQYADDSTDERAIWLELILAGYTAVMKYMQIPLSIGTYELDRIMIMAAGRGNLSVVNLMWQLGANDIVKTLAAAASNGYVEIVKKMQLLGAYDIRVIGYAAGMGHVEVVKFLLHGRAGRVSQDANQAISLAALYGKSAIIDLLDELNYHYDTRLGFLMAARGGHTDIMIKMDKKRTTSIADLNSALIMAAHGGFIEATKWLLQAGANNVPLALAQAGSSDDIVDILEEDIHKQAGKQHGESHLVAAAQSGNLDLVKKSTRDRFSSKKLNNALQAAARNGHIDVINFLFSIAAARIHTGKILIAAAAGPSVEEYESIRGPLYQNAYWNFTKSTVAARTNIVHYLINNYFTGYRQSASDQFALIEGGNINSAIIAAAISGTLEIVQYLMNFWYNWLSSNPDIMIEKRKIMSSFGFTATTGINVDLALYEAAVHDHSAVVEFILQNHNPKSIVHQIVKTIMDADNFLLTVMRPNKYGYYGEPEYLPTRSQNRYLIIKMLLPHVVSGYHLSKIIDWAASRGYRDIVRLIIARNNDYLNGITEVAIYTLLFTAINAARSGYLLIVSDILHQVSDFVIPGKAHNKIVQAASQGGHNTIIKTLMDGNNYSIDALNKFVNAAAKGGHIATMKLLHDYGASYTRQTMLDAILNNRANVVYMLIDAGINVSSNLTTIIHNSNVDLLHIYHPQRQVMNHRYYYHDEDRYLWLWLP